MATLDWYQTFSLARSQGLDDVAAAQAANNWAQRGGKPIDQVQGGLSNTSLTQYKPPTSWTDDQYKLITGTTRTPTATNTGSTLTLNPKLGAGTIAPAATKTPTSYFSGQDALTSMLSNMPKYKPLSESQMRTQAQDYANLQINPQLTALQKSLQNALTALANQENSVNANYASLQTSAEDAKTSAAKRALESAVSRGGGRAGAVEWETAEATKPIDAALMQAEATKTAELNNLANNRTLAQQQFDLGNESLQGQMGTLVAQQLAAIKERDYALQTGDWERATSLQATISQMAMKADELQNNRLLDWTKTMGQTPGGIGSSQEIGLRSYATSKGATVNWDPSTGNVSVNNYTYSPAQLQQYGAKLVNGTWMIPQSLADTLF